MKRETLQRLTALGRERAMVRALDVATGTERLIDPGADFSALGLAAAAALKDDASRTVTVEGRDWFLTVYNAPWELVIVGGVHIAQALAALAIPLGYRVRVIDPRTPYASEERFPGVTLMREWPDEALCARPLSARSALVVLAHDPKLDDPALAAALRSPAAYIGALGSTRTHAKRLARLGAMGFSAAELARIHGPVGLAIGARTPGEIALSILAQMTQLRRMPKDAPGPRRIGGVILAAGMSRRMGKNKLLVKIGGKVLVRHAVDAALASQLSPVIVVTGHDAAAVRESLSGLDVSFVQNPHYADGLSTSLRAGLAALPDDCDGGLVLLGDMPAITPALIDRTIAAFAPEDGHAICVATAHGVRGHPILWGRQFFAAIQALRGDAGAKPLMTAYGGQVREIETGDDAPLADIDTPEALKAYAP